MSPRLTDTIGPADWDAMEARSLARDELAAEARDEAQDRAAEVDGDEEWPS